MAINKVVTDDNILMRGMISAAGSKMLYNFAPPFNAAVADRLSEAGIKDISRSKPNEFGVSLTGAFGCVDAVARGEADIGLGCDVIGSIRREASKNGVCFIKPTYGTVSRYGLVSTAPSMEQIGVACGDIADGFEALSMIAGFDERDGTLADTQKYSFSAPEEDLKGLKVGAPDVCAERLGDEIDRLRGLGADVEIFNFPLLGEIPKTAYIILAAETSGSISRFDGIKFGYRPEKYSNLEDVYIKSRTECFTLETKLLTLMGMLVLSKERYDRYFGLSLYMRGAVKRAADELFKKYGAVIMPAENEKEDGGDAYESFCGAFESLRYLALPNLTGAPAVALPGGVQFMAKAFDENTLFRIGKCFQNTRKMAPIQAPGALGGGESRRGQADGL